MNTDASYVEIVHLSDLHFGAGHRFTLEDTADGTTAAADGMPTLADKLVEDLTLAKDDPFPAPVFDESGASEASEGPEASPDAAQFLVPPFPRILCLSGDFTQRAALGEFHQAERLIEQLRTHPALGIQGVFLCPGNHDLDWSAADDATRWDQYAGFLSRVTGTLHLAKNASRFGGLEVCEPARTVVLSLNTEMKVRDRDGEKSRGDLHPAQLAWAEEQLEDLAQRHPEAAKQYVKVAMVHHHPVLLPSSAEAGRGYDAITGADKLLPMLHDHGFQVVLHGHKHYPHTFREDVRNAFVRTSDHSLFIVAGGTCGSTELPTPDIATQCYNRVRVHWCAREGTTRVQVATRGLVTRRDNGQGLLPNRWHWRTLAIDDRHHIARRRSQVSSASSMKYAPPVAADSAANRARTAEYERTAGHFPVAEVMPAMLAGQTAEVQLRIVRHKPEQRIWPRVVESVVWSGGDRYFPSVRIMRADDPEFRATFAYYGGALLQAELHFDDGTSCVTHVYVPMLTSQ